MTKKLAGLAPVLPILLGLIALLVLSASATAADYTDNIPLDNYSCQECDTYTLNRENQGGSNYDVTYNVVRDNQGCTIKFEDAVYQGSDKGLGEDGAVETDNFKIRTLIFDDNVDVKIKAGENENTVTLRGVGSTITTYGFTITFVDRVMPDSYYIYTFTVKSDDDNGTKALSHVEFDFCPYLFVVSEFGGIVAIAGCFAATLAFVTLRRRKISI